MPGPQPQVLRDLIQRRLVEAEAVHRRAEDAHQVGVVGLVSWIGELAELFAGQRMHDPRFHTGRPKGALHDLVVIPGSFNDDDLIVQAVPQSSLLQLHDRQIEVRPQVRQRRRGQQHLAVVIAEHPFGARLGAVDAGNAEMLRPDPLHAIGQPAPRLVHKTAETFGRLMPTPRPCSSDHVERLLGERQRKPFPLHEGSPIMLLLFIFKEENHIPRSFAG
jgi:hypothetical protein